MTAASGIDFEADTRTAEMFDSKQEEQLNTAARSEPGQLRFK
jgi:hypothetical protein